MEEIKKAKRMEQINKTSNIDYRGVTVTLIFKYTITSDFVFTLSYNEAMQSGFLIPLLESEEEKLEYIYEIPKTLYEKTREIDLREFYKLWKGKSTFTKYDIPHKCFDYKQILKLVQVFNLNKDLPFVQNLESIPSLDEHSV
tara:strand:- start:5421 stop:5846 length:426 start_codon:yes stop_codon:yes gene_type:complete